MASSEYIFRKPSPMIFKLALKKANLNPNEVWYCGDNPIADVKGSSSVGIFPVWYDNYHTKQAELNTEHLYINEWSEMINVLEELE